MWIKMLIKKPSLINLIIESDERWNEYVLKQHQKKAKLQIVDLDDIIPNFSPVKEININFSALIF